MPSERELFERLFSGRVDPSELTKEMLTFGIYQFFKWDAIQEEKISEDDEETYTSRYFEISNRFTEAQIRQFEKSAKEALNQLEKSAADAIRLPVQSFWRGTWQSVAGGFILLLFMAAAFFLIDRGLGLELVKLFKEI